jgi:hypothetical protein
MRASCRAFFHSRKAGVSQFRLGYRLPSIRFAVVFGLAVLVLGEASSYGRDELAASIGSRPYQLQAVAGEPFGVAMIEVPIGVVGKGQLPRVLLADSEKRAFYPAISLHELPPPLPSAPENPRPILRGGLIDRFRHAMENAGQQIHPPSILRVQFLFRGDQPFEIDLKGDWNDRLAIVPIRLPSAHRELLNRWWSGYTQQASQQFQSADYPPGIEAYLTAMLASRLELPEVDLRSEKERNKKNHDPMSSLELLFGTDAMRSNILYESLKRLTADQVGARVPVPSSPAWQSIQVSMDNQNVAVEPIARAVPPECFYIRFGKFANALWFQELMKGKGDGLAQMIMRRGIDYQANQRMERMLNTQTTVLAKLFGDAIVRDMAIIGNDFYMQEGPSVGIVFESANPELLLTAMTRERESAQAKFASQGARLETVDIDGVPVSFLNTPDNQLRSFLVRREQFVFVATSRHLISRFLAVGRGSASLAQSPVFRNMRTAMPLSNDYSLFAFFSPEFFQNLLSPQYQIEVRRRLAAIARLQLADMATLCAESEGFSGDSLRALIDAELLPPWFLNASEDGQPIREGDRWMDSRRGGRGSFLPISDVVVTDCSSAEAERYAELEAFYTKSWTHTDPLVIGARRFADPEDANVEQLALEAYVTPFGQDKYGWLSRFLAPPIQMQIQLPPDDMVNGQIHLSGDSLLNRNRIPDHVLFVGAKDMLPPMPSEKRKLLDTLMILQQAPIYLGAWPLPGHLDRLPFGLGGGPPDALGFSKLLIGAWRWQAGGFSVLSFDRSILENCMLHLKPTPADDPAQMRLQVRDLENSQLSSWINTFWYRRALHASRGNAMLLDTVQTQFRLPIDKAKPTAERLLDGRLQCSLGGEYQIADEPAVWTSTMWRSTAKEFASGGSDPKDAKRGWMGLDENPHEALPPADYRAPWLGWLRGGQVHLTQLPRNLVLVGKLRLQKLPPVPDISADSQPTLPSLNFNLFTSPFSFFKSEPTDKSSAPAEGKLPKSNDRRDF